MDTADTKHGAQGFQSSSSAEVETQSDAEACLSKPPPMQGKSSHWLAATVTAVALPTVLVSMFGYGVTMGVALSLNLDHGSLINGPFDLLTLLWPGAIMLMTTLGEGDMWQIFWEALQNSFWVGILLGVSTLCGIYILKLVRHDRRHERFALWVRGRFNENMRFREAASVSAAVSIFAIVIVPLMHFAGALLIVAAFVVAMTAPVLGYISGRAYVETMVFAPKVCADTPTHAERALARAKKFKESSPSDKKKGDYAAACVALSATDLSKAYLKAGRQVVANATDVLLWDPMTGQGEVIPRDGMALTSIDQKTYESLIPFVTRLGPQTEADAKRSGASVER